VYRLAVESQIEDRILARQVAKRQLAYGVADDEQLLRQFSAQELSQLFDFRVDQTSEHVEHKTKITEELEQCVKELNEVAKNQALQKRQQRIAMKTINIDVDETEEKESPTQVSQGPGVSPAKLAASNVSEDSVLVATIAKFRKTIARIVAHESLLQEDDIELSEDQLQEAVEGRIL